MSGRRGFTLYEVIVAMVIGAMVLTMCFEVSARLQRVARERSERLGLAGSLGTVVHVVEREIGPAGFDSLAGSDLQLVAANSVTYRAPRGLGVACRLAPDSVVVASDRFPDYRIRVPDPSRDSLLLYLPGDSTTTIDAWAPLPLLSGPVGYGCPTGELGLLFTTVLDSTTLHRVGSGRAIVRTFESVNARGYLSATGWQFGLEGISAAATVQPVAGRLNGFGGFEVIALDRAGLVLVPGQAAAGLDVVIRGLTHRELAAGPGRVGVVGDSLRFGLRLPNVR